MIGASQAIVRSQEKAQLVVEMVKRAIFFSIKHHAYANIGYQALLLMFECLKTSKLVNKRGGGHASYYVYVYAASQF